VFRIRIRIRIRPDQKLFGLKDPDPDPKLLILDPDPAPDLDPDTSLFHTKLRKDEVKKFIIISYTILENQKVKDFNPFVSCY